MNGAILFQNATIFCEHATFQNAFLLINDGKIISISKEMPKINSTNCEIITLHEDDMLIPGMIDIHIHGVNGADIMDASKKSMQLIASSLPKEGTTSFLATTMTQSEERISNALKSVSNYMQDTQQNNGAELLGVHLEGPFINPCKAGAQPSKYIKNPTINQFKTLQKASNYRIKIITLAPEITGSMELIDELYSQGVIISVGHSNATYPQVTFAIKHGLSQVTHLYNQMSGLHHRDPGIVGAAFFRNELMVEIIVDGIHITPEMVNLAYEQITPERLMLITDSMRAKGLTSGTYELANQLVTVDHEKAILSDGTLAGSILKMDQAMRNMHAFTNCSIKDLIKMTSENPAKQLGVYNRKGSITVGKDADLVILNQNLEVQKTFCRGYLAYDK